MNLPGNHPLSNSSEVDDLMLTDEESSVSSLDASLNSSWNVSTVFRDFQLNNSFPIRYWVSPVNSFTLKRLNLVAVSSSNCLFLASGNVILVFQLDRYKVQQDPIFVIHHPNPRDASAAEATDVSPSPFNAILLSKFGSEEILIAVDDAGQVIIWFFACNAPAYSLPKQNLILQNDTSSWSIACHSEKRLIAVGSNNHRITVWNLLNEDKFHLEGHSHNIPSVDFSFCGQFLASCSVDETFKLWNLATMTCVYSQTISLADIRFGSDRWGWSVKFCTPGDLIDRSSKTSKGHRRNSSQIPLLFNSTRRMNNRGSNRSSNFQDLISFMSNREGTAASSEGDHSDISISDEMFASSIDYGDNNEDVSNEMPSHLVIHDTFSSVSAVEPNSQALNQSGWISSDDSMINSKPSYVNYDDRISEELNKVVNPNLYVICTTKKEMHLFHCGEILTRVSHIKDLKEESSENVRSFFDVHPLFESSFDSALSPDINNRMRHILDRNHGRLCFLEHLLDESNVWSGCSVVANQNGQGYVVYTKRTDTSFSLEILQQIPFSSPPLSGLAGISVRFCKQCHSSLDYWSILFVYLNHTVSSFEVACHSLFKWLS